MDVRVRDGVFIGQCRSGVPHGIGTMIFFSGEVSRGTWVNGNRHGICHTVTPDGICYVHEWDAKHIPPVRLIRRLQLDISYPFATTVLHASLQSPDVAA